MFIKVLNDLIQDSQISVQQLLELDRHGVASFGLGATHTKPELQFRSERIGSRRTLPVRKLVWVGE